MKYLIIVLCLIAASFGCRKKDKVVKEATLLGTWQLKKIVTWAPPGLQGTGAVENGKMITFNADSTYADSEYRCAGTFSIDQSLISVTAPCVSEGMPIIYEFSLENAATLQLQDISHPCDEGCVLIFKKL